MHARPWPNTWHCTATPSHRPRTAWHLPVAPKAVLPDARPTPGRWTWQTPWQRAHLLGVGARPAGVYAGQEKPYLTSNILFTVGGAGVVLSSRCAAASPPGFQNSAVQCPHAGS
jgi:hypothetical protein